MTERKRNPEEILEDMINKNVKFQVLEIAAGVGAGIGSIVLGVTKNAAFIAAAPLTLAVALNYFNRRRLDQLTRQQTLLDITEVQRRLSSEIQGVRGRSTEGGDIEFSGMEQIESSVAALSETVAALEVQLQQGVSGRSDASHLTDELVQLRNHQLDLAQSFEAVNQKLRSLPTESGSPAYDSELADLKASVAQLQSLGTVSGAQSSGVELESIRTEIQSLIDPLQVHLNDLESRWGQASGAPSEASVNLEPLRAELMQMVSPVHQQLAAMEERMAAQPMPSAAPDRSEEIQGVHGQVNSLNEKLENIAAQLSAEIAGFHKSVEHTQDRVQAVQQSVQDAQIGAISAPDADSVQRELQAALNPLQEKVAELQGQLSSLPKVDPSVSQIQSEQMISLQNQLNSTNGLIEEVAAQLTAELSKIPQLIDEKVDHKVASLPIADPQAGKKDALSELDAILADISL
jgi:chromosome segregation ATPase